MKLGAWVLVRRYRALLRRYRAHWWRSRALWRKLRALLRRYTPNKLMGHGIWVQEIYDICDTPKILMGSENTEWADLGYGKGYGI